ncbi:MAG: bifunctional phosphoribosylaminoimidazolecarboxamide formyltransferase/IMP cyclohydrolase [Alphaproteobacteria bacterium]
MKMIKTALLSVSDKTGLIPFATYLDKKGIKLLSTGGTAKAIRDANIPVTDVSDVTKFPEMMDGRVKTLHPMIHGGILNIRENEKHQTAVKEHGILSIDLVVINLYPFEETVAKGADFETCIENIDIGGPTMVRSAAKNFNDVAIITDVTDYAAIESELETNNGATSFAFRKVLSAKAFNKTAAYDTAISNWFATQDTEKKFPDALLLSGTKQADLRYGENPHQAAAFYTNGTKRAGVATAKQLNGKELSFNNLNDTDAAFELVAEFGTPAVAIIKHANPCGVATAKTLVEAYKNALRCDPMSAFGGIIAINRPLDLATAQEISTLFAEVVIAPSIEKDAEELLCKKKNLRLLVTGEMPNILETRANIRTLSGGYLVQNQDIGNLTKDDLKVVTKRQPTEQEWDDLLFAWKTCKHVKSNAIIYTKDGATVGIGAGQMSRIDSARIAAHKSEIAAEKAGLPTALVKGSVVASDAFFPFADGLITTAEAGATAVIQPGGSVRDPEVIAAADERGIAMVFTGMRHFRH